MSLVIAKNVFKVRGHSKGQRSQQSQENFSCDAIFLYLG